MEIKLESRSLRDVAVLVPDIFQDSRGFFMETFREDQFKALGLPSHFVQDNHSRSARGVVRGLHFQWEPPMGKLMRVTSGSAFLVGVDIRKGSPTLGKWVGVEASARIDARCGLRQDSRGAFAFSPNRPRFNTSARAFTTTRPNRGFYGTTQRSASNGPFLLLRPSFPKRTRKPRRWSNGSLDRNRTISNFDSKPRLNTRGAS